ncbi:MAG: hypothetical protein JO062_16080 [Bryobacterales bacterium]|nr:hypothetical protein [Bryobacterales bacterium]
MRSVAAIPGGSRLIWNPIHLAPQASKGAEVAAVLVPASGEDLITLDPRKASEKTEWQLPERPQVIALLFGPEGLSDGKIKSLVTHNPELLREMAVYAEQSSEVESLIQQLAAAEQSGSGADAVLKGFASQYGAAAPRLDPKASSDQQAAVLLKALLPASNTFDPLAAHTAQVQQSGGLAGSLAGMFFGNPVALAAGGIALFQNLKTAIFPATEFRSAFVPVSGQSETTLCTKNVAPPASKTRTGYLWAYRVPQVTRPGVSIEGTPHLPLGSKSAVAIKIGEGSTSKNLGLARDWRLTPVGGGASTTVAVQVASAGSLEIDVSNAKLAAGDYQLSATWDWDALPVAGVLHLHPSGDYSRAILDRGERDKLIEGSGTVTVKLSATDFEFLEKTALEPSAGNGKGEEISFTLPKGKRAGPQDSVVVNINTAKRGSYRLLLVQSGGATGEVPVTILPPNPKISNLPVRLNAGDERETIHLEGEGLERIQSVVSDVGTISGAPNKHGWSGEVGLNAGVAKGQKYALVLKVSGLETPIRVPDAIEIVGPRPAIRSVQRSVPATLGITLAADELPAGNAAGLALTVDHLNSRARPKVELGCENGEPRQHLTLSPGESSGGASLSFAGPGALFLSIDAGTVGYVGCRLTATVIVDPEGRSDAFVLGRVIRVPRLDKFTLTTEKAGDSSYAGIVEGHDLDVIEKAGWDADNGVPVESIPVPNPGDSSRQTLRVVLPWPAPAPHAPLYVWLRGETNGRSTTVTY